MEEINIFTHHEKLEIRRGKEILKEAFFPFSRFHLFLQENCFIAGKCISQCINNTYIDKIDFFFLDCNDSQKIIVSVSNLIRDYSLALNYATPEFYHSKIPYSFSFSKSEEFILPFTIQITKCKTREELNPIFRKRNQHCISYTPHHDVLYISKKAYVDCMNQTKQNYSFDSFRGLNPVGIITDDFTI